MATTIKLKNGSGAPLAGDLVAGEPALDLTNKRLYTEDSGGTVIEVGTNPSTLTVDTTTLVVDATNNRVGVGTASPGRTLDVEGIIRSNGTSSAFALGGNSSTPAEGAAIHRPANGTIAFVNESSESMRIDSSGNVGIGATTVDSALHIEKSTPRVTLQIAGNSGYNTIESGDVNELIFGRSGTEQMRIDDSGNVGIGTTSPAANLHVQTSDLTFTPSTAADEFLIEGGTNAGMSIASSSNGYLLFGDAADNDVGAIGYSHSSNAMSFTVNASERMRIDSSGKVGIGTSTVGSADGSLLTLSASTGVYTQFNVGTSGGGAVGSEGVGLEFYTYTGNVGSETYTKRMRIDSSGNVIVKSGGQIQASNSANDRNLLLYNDNNAATVRSDVDPLKLQSADRITFNTSGANERMRIDSSGNLLVFRTTPGTSAAKIDVQSASDQPFLEGYMPTTGVTRAAFVVRSNVGSSNTSHLVIRADGDVENTNNSYGALSDERLKSNIVDASSQIDDIMAVQVRSYTLNETGATHIGVVAQELEASGMSGLVKTDNEGMKAVKYSVLYMKAIKALQEAVTRIETLEAEVAALKGA